MLIARFVLIVMSARGARIREKMPRNLRFFLALSTFLAACGPKPAAKDCPALNDQPDCSTQTLSYSSGISDLVNRACMPCHAPGGEESSVPLTDYKHVAGESMTIGNELVLCEMPPDGSPELGEDDRKQMLDWLSCGAPE